MTPEEMTAKTEDNVSVAFMRFTDSISSVDAETPFCFIEGYDEPYYGCFIRPVTIVEPKFIPCNGKKGVIGIHEFLATKPQYNSYRKLFFVDKDYDDNSHLDADFCITEGYSIENYYCDERVIRNFLRTVVLVNEYERESEIDSVVNDFHQWETEFVEGTKSFCAWYKCVKSKGLSPDKKKDYKTHFPTKFGTISQHGNSFQPYGLQDLNAEYIPASPILEEDYNSSLAEISVSYDIRGKFVLEFMDEYIQHLVITAKKDSPLLKKGFSFQKDRKTLMARIAPCAICPPSLKNYIFSRVPHP